jgi:hypothetical protein
MEGKVSVSRCINLTERVDQYWLHKRLGGLSHLFRYGGKDKKNLALLETEPWSPSSKENDKIIQKAVRN